MPRSFVRFFSRKYIAGETIESAVKLVKEFNSKDIYATMDVLGESVKNEEEAVNAFNNAMKVFDAIVDNNLKANLSVKPTQLGLEINEELAYEHILKLVKRANEIDNFVRIDMEDSPYTDTTIDIYKKVFENYNNVGIVLQAYLKRTYNDTVLLNKLGTDYRLCKGIYIEPASIAYKSKETVRDNYVKVLETMLKNGNYVGIATHDEYLINEAYRLIKELKIQKDKFEFQMLLGVREDLRDKINNDGFKIRIYVPFGKDWYPYSIRRLKENPKIAWHILKNIFSFKR
ncbi:proline dehydrogenase family protein [bacterium BMS3Abin03]|nr:proline dehydrogenase family protein [bacterium BMS3Abin03]MCG6961475.1 proline dehydrogenase family protein [bacterium BMS3Abin03]